jgi:hypothetical protein
VMPDIFCIYPYDRTTKSLNKIVNHISLTIPVSSHIFKIKARPDSHAECLNKLIAIPETSLIIFLGHGRTNYLYGACHDNYSMIGASPSEENNYYGYQHQEFINFDNIDVFKDKKVFSLACNTAKLKGLGQKAVEKGGAKVYLGFGEIPTSQEEIKDRLKLSNIQKRIPERFKGEINLIIKEALSYSIKNNHSFFEFEKQISLITNKRAHDIVMRHKNLSYRRLLADMLYLFRRQMKLYGNGNLKLIG